MGTKVIKPMWDSSVSHFSTVVPSEESGCCIQALVVSWPQKDLGILVIDFIRLLYTYLFYFLVFLLTCGWYFPPSIADS